jgi:hypothetical protein
MPIQDSIYQPTVEALFKLFSNALLEKFNQPGHDSLHRDEVEAILAYFQAGSPELEAYYERLFGAYDRLNSALAMNRMRSDEFNRLIVESFEDRLSDRAAPKDGKIPADRIPRETLPAMFHVMRQVLGAEFIEKSATTCREVRHAIQDRDGPAFSWEAFFLDPMMIQVQQRTLARFIVYFREDFEKKKKWMVRALNYNASDADLRGGLASSYLFAEGKLKLLLYAMIRRVDAGAMTAADRAVLAKNIGEERIKTIERVKMDVKLLDDNRLF